MKVIGVLQLGAITLAVLSLLVWLPSPSSGGAKVFAWLLILWPAITVLVSLLVSGAISDVVTKTPYAAVSWVSGNAGAGPGTADASPLRLTIGVAYLALMGYGLASVLGKKLE
jgi:hypothetical protein